MESNASSAAAIRVARVITRLNVGGPAIQAVSLSARLRDYEVLTELIHGRLSAGEGDMAYLLASHNVKATQLPTLRREVAPLDDLRTCWQIFRIFCRFRPHIVHTHTAKAGAVGRLAAVAYNLTAGRRHPTRIVHTYHGHVLEGYFSRIATACFVTAERLLARRTDALVAISPGLQRELEQRHRIGRPRQYRLIPLGFDLTSFAALDAAARVAARRQLSIPADVAVVTFVGRLTAIKDPLLFLDMARLLASQRSDVVFLIAGGGDLTAQVESAVRTPILANRVRLLGWQGDLVAVYGATDVLVITSRNEGTPVALIEAMAAGVSCVSTDVGGVRDVVTSEDLGIVVRRDDQIILAEAVSALIDDPNLRRRIAENARQSVVQRYKLDRLIRDVHELYTDLLGDVVGLRRQRAFDP